VTTDLDVAVVGAGPAGLGVATTLSLLGVERLAVLERLRVGATFRCWPRETRLLTPSFPANGFGLPDLNAITSNTSPALDAGREHLSGAEYADYLDHVAELFALPVRTGVAVRAVTPAGDGFALATSAGPLRARFVVWAGGEFAGPRDGGFPGAELGVHSARVRAFGDLDGASLVVVGGFESGIDAAVHLVEAGRRVTVLDRTGRWAAEDGDPSRALSPSTRERLDRALATRRLTLVADVDVDRIERSRGGYAVRGGDGTWWSAGPPVLATGFTTGLGPVARLFDWDETARVPLLTEAADESTRTPGLFLTGPEVRHGDLVFCFVYKFRQRFAVVARAIGERLGLDTDGLEALRGDQMYLDDLSCCGGSCGC
jgi:thioredoxin reductase